MTETQMDLTTLNTIVTALYATGPPEVVDARMATLRRAQAEAPPAIRQRIENFLAAADLVRRFP